MSEDVVRVVWISRHELNERNREILDRAFGRWEIVEWVRDTVDVQMLRELAEKHRDAKFVVVLPPQLIMELLRHTNEVFRFIVDRKVREDGSAEFIPIGLEKIKEIKIVTERIV